MNCKVCQTLSTKKPNLSFFRFPPDYNRCKEWANRCNMSHIFDKYGPTKFHKSFRICSDHFDSKSIMFDGRRKKLINSAVPSIFNSGDKANEQSCMSEKVDAETENCTFKLLENLCRFCAEENTDLIDIFSWKGKTLQLEEKMKVFPIPINRCDRLPLKICNQCTVKISKFYDFVKNCWRADRRLKTILSINECDQSVNNDVKGETKSTQTDGQEMETEYEVANASGMGTKNYAPESNILTEKVQQNELMKSRVTLYLSKLPPELSLELCTNRCTAENKVHNRYNCSKCFKTFSSVDLFKSHYRAHFWQPDEQGRYVCYKCNKVFGNKYRLNEHFRIHAGEYPFKCLKCSKKFHKMALLKQHSAVHGAGKRFVCSICHLRSSRKGNLIQHLRTHHNLLRNSNFATETLATEAIKSKKYCSTASDHKEESSTISFQDGERQRGISSGANYVVKDLESKADIKPLCNLCQKPSDLGFLKNHLIPDLTGGLMCRCQDDIRSQDKMVLEYNKRIKFKNVTTKTRPSQRLYQCEECGASFKRKDTLKNHTRIHTGERPFICQTCGFAFKQKGDCLKHERNHLQKSTTHSSET